MPYKYRQNYTKFSIAAQGKGQSIQVGKKKKGNGQVHNTELC